ncbi:hypothetical protein [Leptolyngbya sp. 7M]|uniref:hypothetical protein n=1 Tax=Leptolyngbya sp. 7M TaxID=2812896 RepID=UPI001B8CE5E3|nr:hypothetical protein [Leptolyngbya sp. 7M]QYO66229.1 hypothetical protein JVX88_05360 [Leptolyngbya sp. 7M]
MKLIRFHIYIILSVAFIVVPINAQSKTETDVLEVIKKAAERSKEYVASFRNLISEELRTFEVLREDGSVRRRRTVGSTFIVYQLSSDDDRMMEYRHITSVDGKPIGKADVRAKDFFEKLSRAASSKDEIEQIRKESFRRDEFEIEGYTLFQGIPLAENFREIMEFKFLKHDEIEGKPVLVVFYQQINPSENVRIYDTQDKRAKDVLVDVAVDTDTRVPLNPRLRGTLWIDAATHHILREIREMTAQPNGFPAPVIVTRSDFTYSESEFAIFTPAKIMVEVFTLQIKKKRVIPDVRANMEYTRFTNPDVEVRSGDVKN